jgi:hypothetical protein
MAVLLTSIGSRNRSSKLKRPDRLPTEFLATDLHGFTRISTDLTLWLDRVQRLVQIIEDIVNVFDSY